MIILETLFVLVPADLLYLRSCFNENLYLRNNEFAMTPTELKPMRAPAIDGVSMVPVTGSNTPAAIGSPTCKKASSINQVILLNGARKTHYLEKQMRKNFVETVRRVVIG